MKAGAIDDKPRLVIASRRFDEMNTAPARDSTDFASELCRAALHLEQLEIFQGDLVVVRDAGGRYANTARDNGRGARLRALLRGKPS